MDDPRAEFILFPNIGQWVKLVDWDYSAVKIYEVDHERKQFRAYFLIPPKLGIPDLDYPEVDEMGWISFERIRTTVRKFWQKEAIISHEQKLVRERGLPIGGWVVCREKESPGKVTIIEGDFFKARFFGENNDDGTSCLEDDSGRMEISSIEEVVIRPDKVEILEKSSAGLLCEI